MSAATESQRPDETSNERTKRLATEARKSFERGFRWPVPRSPPQERRPMATEIRAFDLGDVLSIADGRLVSPRHMEGVYDILNFMTSDNLFTHQLPRAFRVCQPALLAQHPQLAEVDRVTTITPENAASWLAAQKRIYGDTLPVAKLAPQTWTEIDPMLEAEAVFGKERVVRVEVPDVG